MRYLITGGCGFLGSNLSSEAIRRGHELIVFDNLFRFGSEINHKWLKGQGEFLHIHGDIRNFNDIEDAIKKYTPDIIFHLSGQVAMTTSIANPRLDFEINTLGTFNLLEAVRKHSEGSLIIYSSTNKVYGDLEWVTYEEKSTRYITPDFPDGFPESITLDFHSPYGCSKGAADQYMLDYHRIFGLKTIVFRHSSIFGGRQFSTYDQGWIGWFCQKAVEIKNNSSTEQFTISGNGKQVRDVIYSSDLINLYFTSVDYSEKIKGNAFNIGGGMGNSLSLLELFAFLEKEMDIVMKYNKLPPRESDQRVFVADYGKIKSMTGWEPQIDKFTGIRSMVEWIRDYLKITR